MARTRGHVRRGLGREVIELTGRHVGVNPSTNLHQAVPQRATSQPKLLACYRASAQQAKIHCHSLIQIPAIRVYTFTPNFSYKSTYLLGHQHWLHLDRVEAIAQLRNAGSDLVEVHLRTGGWQ